MPLVAPAAGEDKLHVMDEDTDMHENLMGLNGEFSPSASVCFAGMQHADTLLVCRCGSGDG